MEKKNAEELLRRMTEIINDFNFLMSVEDESLLTPEMIQAKNDMINWLGFYLAQIHDMTDTYMSTLQAPNTEGFISPVENETPEQSLMRIMRNFRFGDLESGKHDLKDPHLETIKKGSEHYVEGQQPQQQQDYCQQKVTTAYNDGVVEGMAGGYFVMTDPANNVLTEDDYYREPYDEEGEETPLVDSTDFTDSCEYDDDICPPVEEVSLF